MKLKLQGPTEVVENHLEDDEEEVTSPDVLRMIASRTDELTAIYTDQLAFTHFLSDGSSTADAVLPSLKTGGWIRLVVNDAGDALLVETELESDRALNQDEIDFLVRRTIAQWTDGAGAGALDSFSEAIEPYYVEVGSLEIDDVSTIAS